MALDPTKRVEARTTPIGDVALLDALRLGHAIAFDDEPPSHERLGVGWAQTALETGRTKAAWAHNWGNVTAGSSWDGAWLTIPGLPSSEPQNYRAYATAGEGAADYWRIVALMDRRRAGAVMRAFDCGDANNAAAELRAAGYFTAPLGGYQRSLRLLYAEYQRRFPRVADDSPPADCPPRWRAPAIVAAVLTAIGAGAAWLASRW